MNKKDLIREICKEVIPEGITFISIYEDFSTHIHLKDEYSITFEDLSKLSVRLNTRNINLTSTVEVRYSEYTWDDAEHIIYVNDVKLP